MASNELPRKLDRLFALCERMLAGLTRLETELGVVQNTHARLSAALASARAAEMAYGTSKSARKAANATLSATDEAVKRFISLARKRLSIYYGEHYSTEWGAAGWPNASTQMPTTMAERFSLVESIRLHLVRTPAHESVDMDVTAAIAQTVKTDATAAIGALHRKTAEQIEARDLRDREVRLLRRRMNSLIAELNGQMEADDPRWHAFGLNRPADQSTPKAPTVTTAAAGEVPRRISLTWDHPPRAKRFRVWVQIVGVDETFQPVQTVHDSDATVDDLPSGATVRVHITAANDTGESPPGPEVEVVVP